MAKPSRHTITLRVLQLNATSGAASLRRVGPFEMRPAAAAGAQLPLEQPNCLHVVERSLPKQVYNCLAGSQTLG